MHKKGKVVYAINTIIEEATPLIKVNYFQENRVFHMDPKKKIIKHKNHAYLTRLSNTKSLMLKYVSKDSKILDLGPDNSLRTELKKIGFAIEGTGTQNLDSNWITPPSDVVTAFEIIEHLRNPYVVLKSIQAKKLILSVPLNVWFSKPYWNDSDPFSTHFHEFYPKQIKSLLDVTGWNVIHEEKWKWKKSPLKPRPLLRRFGPWYSWIAIVAERS